MIGVLHDYLLLHYLFGFAFDLNMFFSQRLLSVTNNLILEVIQSQWIAHDKFGLCNIGPFGLESDGEIADAVPLDWESGGVGVVDDEIIAIFGRVGKPGDFDVPVSFGIVDYRQVLGDLTAGRHIHL